MACYAAEEDVMLAAVMKVGIWRFTSCRDLGTQQDILTDWQVMQVVTTLPALPSRALPSRAVPSRALPSRAVPSRASCKQETLM